MVSTSPVHDAIKWGVLVLSAGWVSSYVYLIGYIVPHLLVRYNVPNIVFQRPLIWKICGSIAIWLSFTASMTYFYDVTVLTFCLIGIVYGWLIWIRLGRTNYDIILARVMTHLINKPVDKTE